MKVIAINGSPNKDGNTRQALDLMAETLALHGIETEIVHVGNKPLQGCIGCNGCFKSGEFKCVFNDDAVNVTAEKLKASEGFIIGSPTYFGGIAGTCKAFLDRVFYPNYGGQMARKVGAVAVAARRLGGEDVVHQLNNYLQLVQAVIPPSRYWAMIYGLRKGEITQDLEGMQVLRDNAQSMAWLLKVLDAAQNTIAPYELEAKVMTNFVR